MKLFRLGREINPVLKRWSVFFIVFGGVLGLSHTTNSGPEQKVRIIVIDPGHGGKDPGCNGSIHKEKDVTLSVALKLGEYIEKNIPDVKVIYTRKTDVFIGLEERAIIANNAKADLFISIHCNAAANKITYKDSKGKIRKKEVINPEAFGAETYVMDIKNEKGKTDVAQRENAAILLEDDYKTQYEGFDPNSPEAYIIMSMYTDVYTDRSINIASKIQKEYKEKAARSDKGVKRASLWVLWRTGMPSILTEIGFLTNPVEENFLGSAEGQDYIAKSLFLGIRNYKFELEGISGKSEDEFEKLERYNPAKDSIAVKKILAYSDSLKNFAAKSIEKKAENPDEKGYPLQAKGPDTPGTEEKKLPIILPPENKQVNEAGKIQDSATVKEKSLPEKKSEVVQPPAIYFSVQILSSDKTLPPDSEKFKGEKTIEYADKGIFKYTVGELNNLEKAAKLQGELRNKGFRDAFIVAFREGVRIPVNEAVKALNGN